MMRRRTRRMIVLASVMCFSLSTLLLGSTAPAASAEGTWELMLSGTTDNLEAIWGTSVSDIFACASDGTIYHYNGTTWSAMDSGTTEPLYGISGTLSMIELMYRGSQSVFAVGGSSAGIIVHYDGSTWDEMTSNAPHRLWDVCCVPPPPPAVGGSRDFFAVGDEGSILRYDGGDWTLMTSGTTANLYGVWGTSTSDVFAVGGTTVLHYDGTAWSQMNTGDSTCSLRAVWGNSSSNVFAVGYGVEKSVLHYDGDTWSEMSTLGPWIDLVDVWGYGPTDVFAVAEEARTILHYDGISWTEASSGYTHELYGVWGSQPQSGNAVFFVGGGGTVIRHNLPPDVWWVRTDEGHCGQTLTLEIVGGFASDATEVVLGEGVTVNSFHTTISNRVYASVTIDEDASTGTRNLTVTTLEGTDTLESAFTIERAPPTIAGIEFANTDDIVRGEPLEVIITGTYLTDMTEISFGEGVTVNSSTVDSSSQITASITIDEDAAIGARDVTVVTPGGSVVLEEAITVPPKKDAGIPVWTWVAVAAGAAFLMLVVALGFRRVFAR